MSPTQIAPPAVRSSEDGRVHLDLTVFGNVRLLRNHVPVTATPFQTALLLLMDDRGDPGLSRQSVCDLLWPPEADTVIRHRFSQLV